jgi:hypothetical protein
MRPRRRIDDPVHSLTGELEAPNLPLGFTPAEPTRGLRSTPRSRLRTFVVGLSGGSVVLATLGVVALATLVSPFGAQAASRAAAERELEAELAPGERVVARAEVAQRNWWDNYRESYGLLVATDRRMVFVGLPPMPWIRRADEGPPELRVQSFGYETPYTVNAEREFLGTAAALVVRTPAGPVSFLYDGDVAAGAAAVELAVDRAQQARRDAFVEERMANMAPPPPPPVYVTHVVRYGEAMSSIARRYRTTTEVIRQLNNMRTDAIRAGQRLRVPAPEDLPTDSLGAPAGPPGATPSSF